MAAMLRPGRRRAKERYRAQSEGPHELRPDVGFLPQLVRDGPAAMDDAVARDGALVGFGGGGTYGSPEHIARLESQLAAAQKEIERLRMRLKQFDERNRATEAKANEQGALLLRESTRHERFATLIKAAEAENKRLAKRLAQADRRTADDIRQLELTISSMEEECHSLRIERDTMEEELVRERNRASQHEFAAKRQTMDHGALVKALSVTKEEKEIETKKRQAVETDLAAAQDEVATHLARIHRMDEETAQLRAALSQTDSTVGARLTEVEEELEGERSRHMRAKSALRSLQETQASADEHWRQKIEALKEEIDSAAKSGDWQRSKLLGLLLQKQGEAYAEYHDDIGAALAQAQAAAKAAADDAAAAAAAAAAEAEAKAEEAARAEGKERKETPVDLEALQVWEDAFKKFDYDNSGSIDKGELKKAMKALGRSITEAEAVSMMEEADADRSGEIDFMEFRKLVAKKSKSKLWYDAATQAAMDAAIKIQQVRTTPVDRLAGLGCALHHDHHMQNANCIERAFCGVSYGWYMFIAKGESHPKGDETEQYQQAEQYAHKDHGVEGWRWARLWKGRGDAVTLCTPRRSGCNYAWDSSRQWSVGLTYNFCVHHACRCQAAQRARAKRSMQGYMQRAMMSNNAVSALESQKYGSDAHEDTAEQ